MSGPITTANVGNNAVASMNATTSATTTTNNTTSTTKASTTSNNSSNANNASSSSSGRGISRSFHPSVQSVFGPTCVEFSTWAHLFPNNNGKIPNLVTAHENVLRIHVVDPCTGHVITTQSTYEYLAGSICTLHTIPGYSGIQSDALLLGFAGHPRLSVVVPNRNVLQASSLIDLTPALQEACRGSVTPLDQDIQCTIHNNNNNNNYKNTTTTVSVILGGGVAIAVLELFLPNNKNNNNSTAVIRHLLSTEPYILPLHVLNTHLDESSSHRSDSNHNNSNNNRMLLKQHYNNKYNHNNINYNATKSVAHGFGDIYSQCFVLGFTEPTLVILHSKPGGRLWPGRISSSSSQLQSQGSKRTTTTTKNASCLTAISISMNQRRSVVLWSAMNTIPPDAHTVQAFSDGLLLVVCVNSILVFDRLGKVLTALGVNGWVHATSTPSFYQPLPYASNHNNSNNISNRTVLTANPHPLKASYSIALDNAHVTFLSNQQQHSNVAILSTQLGQLYALEYHPRETCLSLLPWGVTIGSIGMVSTTTICPTMPLLFIGSRLGDSTLLQYTILPNVPLFPKQLLLTKEEEPSTTASLQPPDSKRVKLANDNNETNNSEKGNSTIISSSPPPLQQEDEEAILAKEEEELYDEDDDIIYNINEFSRHHNITQQQLQGNDTNNNSEEQQVTKLTIQTKSLFGPMKILDSLTGLGPLGPGCTGSNNLQIHPCGYGSSGGLAILSCPGYIKATEVDCSHMSNVFCLTHNFVLLIPSPKTANNNQKINNNNNNKSSSSDNNYHPCILLQPTVNQDEKQLEQDTTTTLKQVDYSTWSQPSQIPNSTSSSNNNHKWNIQKVFSQSSDCRILHIMNCHLDGQDFTLVMMEERREISSSDNTQEPQRYTIILLKYSSPYKQFLIHHVFDNLFDMTEVKQGYIQSISSVQDLTPGTSFRRPTQKENVELSCLWSTGHVSILIIATSTNTNYANNDGNNMDVDDALTLREIKLMGNVPNNNVHADNNFRDDDSFVESDETIVATDIFTLAEDIFSGENSLYDKENLTNTSKKESSSIMDTSGKSEKDVSPSPSLCKDEVNKKFLEDRYGFDADDFDLYDENITVVNNVSNEVEKSNNFMTDMVPTRYNTLGGYISGAHLSPDARVYIAVCRQFGRLQVYDLEKLQQSNVDPTTNTCSTLSQSQASSALVWETDGCGVGHSLLVDKKCNNIVRRKPCMHDVTTNEFRFFFCGPSDNSMNNNKNEQTKNSSDLNILRSFCLLIENSLGDIHLYTGTKKQFSSEKTTKPSVVQFQRVSLRLVSRSSKEAGRHNLKLKRKGIISDEGSNNFVDFRKNRFLRFSSVSNHDGIFVATSRPLWILSERGTPSALFHRLRHAAPAGGKIMPVSGFCSGLKQQNGGCGFFTLHERIGRVGSQRLTFYNDLSDVFTPHGLLPGGGLCVQKIPLSVTVRKIEFINHSLLSSTEHPFYALLVSREIESDQSHLNDDGLTDEERQRAKDEKEAAKTRRQVEADLGGFDVEQEWVEEIERDDCFEIDKNYGGAPPIPDRIYELWLVDGANWNVVDTYQFDEYEHGMTMKVLTLTENEEEQSSGTSSTKKFGDESLEESLFIAVGTGIVDQDGEDISSKGRIILFSVKRITNDDGVSESGELTFVYDKNILLGPVTSLTCLSCENKNRLVVGAGAEITVEQWGNNRLTQVGFFHANMQVQEITIFKTFFLLSDAYDSLHFLVWRESDKSLTLLAKDYEPTAVYAAGLLSRGGSVSFVCHDDRQNLQFFQYAPKDPAARGGNKLVCRADFHLGTQTVGFQSYFCRSSLLINSATTNSSLVALKQQDNFYGKLDEDQRFGVFFGTTDGGFGTIVPLSEQVYWRLAALQSVMSNALESHGGLSHRGWRLYRRTPRRGGCRNNDRKKGVIDGDLIIKYTDLALPEQEDLASAIGSTVELIVDNLLELSCANMVL